MKREMTVFAATPQEMEIITDNEERRTLSFRTSGGYFALTDAANAPHENSAVYYDVGEIAYEEESLSLYFDEEAKFQDEYDVVVLHWPMNEKIIDFLAGYLFLGTPLKLALNADGRNRLQ